MRRRIRELPQHHADRWLRRSRADHRPARRADHRRADPAPCRRQRRGDARGGPGRRRHRPRGPHPRLARGAGLREPRGGTPQGRRHLRQPAPFPARRPARRRQVRADRRPSGPPAHPVPVRPGRRSLDPRARRLRPRAPSTERPRRLRCVCRHRRAARRARRDRGRRAARRDRDAPLPRQRPPPLRPPAQLPGGAAGRGRRDLLVQPHLRAGNDGGRGPGGRAARLPRARRARPRPPLLPRRQRPRSITPGSCRSAPTWRCPRSRGRRSARVRLINAYLRRLRATAEHDPAVAGALIAVVGMLERPPHVLRPAIAARVARGPRALPCSERVEGVRRRELRIGGATHPAARGRTAGRRGGRRLPARQPGLERGLGAAARRHRPPLACCGLGCPRIRPSRPRRSRFGRPSRHTRSSSAARSTRSGSSASISSHTTSVGPGA